MSSRATTIDGAVRAAAAARPDALALGDAPNRNQFFAGEPNRLTWSEVDAMVDAVAADLQKRGIGIGGRVAIQLPNCVELALVILACARLRAIAVPFPIQHRDHELRYGLAVAGVSVMVTAPRPDRPDQLATVSAVIADLGESIDLVSVADPDSGLPPLQLEPGAAPSLETTPAADDVVSICWTSGTTGTPKGVPRSNSMWLASGAFQVDQLGLNSEDRILCPFPVVNMAGIGGMLVPWAMAGAELHLHQPLDLPVFLQQLQSERITYTVAPPPLLNMLLANEEMLDSVDLSSIRAISSGSAPLDPWMVEGWQARGIEIVNVFGSNEGASMLATSASVPDPANRARFFPRPDREGVETRLVDLATEDDIEDANQPGELRFRGATVFDGYLDSTGEEFDSRGFYRTGDIFEWVEGDASPRLLRFVDRAKDIIIRGGMNISAAEVEGLVSSMETISECAAVAFPDRDLGEKVGIFVVPAGDAQPDLDSVVSHLRDVGVASYKLPERLETIESLPRNPVGKVTKTELRDRWR